MRPAILLLCALLAWAETEAETATANLGAAAPGYADAIWLRGAAPVTGTLTVVVFWTVEDDLDTAAIEAIEGVGVALLADLDEAPARELAAKPGRPAMGISTGELTARWLGPEAPIPAAALVGADGILLWRGRLPELARAVAREKANGFDRARLAEVAALRAKLRTALDQEDGTEQALELTAQILVHEPVDEEAVRLRLDLSRHLGQRDIFRDTLAALPLEQLPATFANELAWERATEPDLPWRTLDQALRLSVHARAQDPEDGAIEDTHARILYLLGMIDDAVSAQLRAVSLRPDEEAIRDALDYYREVQALRQSLRKRDATPLPMP